MKIRRGVAAAVMTTGLVLTSSLVSPSAEAAARPNYMFKDVATQLCLQYNGNGTVITARCVGTPIQRWEKIWSPVRDVMLLRNVGSSTCLGYGALDRAFTFPCDLYDQDLWFWQGTMDVGRSITSWKYEWTLDSDLRGRVYFGPSDYYNGYQQWVS